MNRNKSTNVNEALRLEEQVDRIKSREDFVAFVRALQAQLAEAPGAWENRDLPSFLEGLAAWVEDMVGCYKSAGEPVPPTGKTLGQILLAARIYE